MLNAKKLFGIDFKKVILTGDQAGGTLVLAVTALAIDRKFRVPDFIMPIYPITLCSFDEFVPSHLLAFDHIVTSASYMHFMTKWYLPKESADEYRNCPLLSPGRNLSPATLAKFPETKIVVAEIDVFRDESLLLLARLLEHGAKASAVEMRNLCHGFLEFGVKNIAVNTSVLALDYCIDLLKDAINK